MKRVLRNKRGVALAAVIIIFAVVSIIGTTMLVVTRSQTSLSVASKDTTTAHYYARSAVDIISAKMAEKIQAVIAFNPSFSTSTALSFTAAEELVDDYNVLLQAVFDYLPLPADPANPAGYPVTRTIAVTITPDNPVTAVPPPIDVLVTSYFDRIVVQATVDYGNGQSTARAKLSQLSLSPTSIAYAVPSSSFVGNDALYAWGNISVVSGSGKDGANSTNVALNGGGTISAGGSASEIKGVAAEAIKSPVPHDMLILTPPPVPAATSPIAELNSLNKNSAYIGYYGALGTLKNGKIDGATVNWTIDTSKGDVTLIFDRFWLDGNSSINVKGDHNLKIYIKEPYVAPTEAGGSAGFTTNTLIDVSGNASITWTNAAGTADPTKPHTYFIAYNDVLQWYDTKIVPGATSVPFEDIATTFAAADYDTIRIDNHSDMAAFFYLPACNLAEMNNHTLYGAVYASSIAIQGNKTINYVPFDFDELTSSGGSTGSTPPPSIAFTQATYTFSDPVWLKS